MSYLEKHLRDEETLAARGRLHWMIFRSPLLYILAGLFFTVDGMGWIIRTFGLSGLNKNLGFTQLVGAIENLTGLEANVLVGISFFLIAAGVLYCRIVRYYTTEIGLTNRRVILKVGWLRTDAVDVLLDRVDAIYVQQSFLGRVFNYGALSFATGDGGSVFSWIADPEGLRLAVQEQIDHPAERRDESESTGTAPEYEV